MAQAQLDKFLKYLQRQKWIIFGPVFVEGEKEKEKISPYLAAHNENSAKGSKLNNKRVIIQQINDIKNLALGGFIPEYPFKNFFLPEKETLFVYKNNHFFEKINSHHKIALFGVNDKDLKAINLYDLVFANDKYYQARRKNLLIIGCPSPDFEEKKLPYLPFDIFLNQQTNNIYQILAGSIKGQRILEHFGYKNYEIIKFQGPEYEIENNDHLKKIYEKMANFPQTEIWEKLGKICLECGKCSLVCPTCFCFRIDDKPALENGGRERCWDSCFFHEFSEVAGGHKFLTNTAERIHFWYLHKFVRIVQEFGFAGCVRCNRCSAVCPAKIEIKKVLEEIINT